jgi:hypothetical protein
MRNKVFLALILALLALSGITSAVYGIASPDSMNLPYAQVFKNVFELNDMLILCRYNIAYASLPSEDANTTFIMYFLDGTGVVKAERAMIPGGYNNDVNAIYLTAAEVTAKAIAWGGTYTVRIAGNPAIFPSTVKADLSLNSSSWVTSTTVSDGQDNLSLAILTQSVVLEGLDSTLDLLTVDTTGSQKLSSTGVNYWSVVVPGINSFENLVASSVSYPNVTSDNWTGAYFTTLNTMGGATFKANFTDLANNFHIPWWQPVAFLFLGLLPFIIVSGIVTGATGNTKAAGIVGGLVCMVCCMLIPDALLIAMAAVLSVVFVWIMWRFV